ncbi:MAG: ATP-grasp domain-containing protein [Planctomycetes bacterium]|nr:ATP-grasp domain-containing protein [Planctomycetota bacterium]
MSPFNVLISSAGRRIGLLESFRQALRVLGLNGRVYAIDCSSAAPAFHLADSAWLVPRCTEPDFAATVLALCKRECVALVVPTIDPELPLYAAARAHFEAHRISVAVSDPETVHLCYDKQETHAWLVAKGFPTTRQAALLEVLRHLDGWRFPLIAKPRYGSASVGVRRAHSHADLLTMADPEDAIVQEIVAGQEYTINVYVDRSGQCRCAIPHARLEVRAGEVAKALTVKHRPLMELARGIAEALPGAYGPLNIQCFVSPAGDIRVIEINARFGGGYPLAERAGASFTRWLIEEALGLEPAASFDGWQDDLAMLRYDQAVYLPGARIREDLNEPALRRV